GRDRCFVGWRNKYLLLTKLISLLYDIPPDLAGAPKAPLISHSRGKVLANGFSVFRPDRPACPHSGCFKKP
ncbi:hypothetical protein P3W85_25950, partial [Cupriavidus basilensis]